MQIVCAINYLPHMREQFSKQVRELLLPKIRVEARGG
jgi:hypothetical protein